MVNPTRATRTIDVTPRAIVVSVGNESRVVFERNTTIPCRRKTSWLVTPPLVVANVYAQEREVPPTLLTSINISIPSVTGRFRFMLSLDLAIDANGILTITDSFQKIYRSTYDEYLDSPTWQTKRQEALGRAGHKCQLCGATNRLDVHHNTYERLGNELPADLIVLCRSCHEMADKRRRAQRDDEIYDRRLAGWARKVYGEYWEESPGYEVAAERFDEWLESRDDD